MHMSAQQSEPGVVLVNSQGAAYLSSFSAHPMQAFFKHL
jgi:hypothetical protein